MATHTILINNSTNKTKHLLGLIKEMENGNVFRAKDTEDIFMQLNR